MRLAVRPENPIEVAGLLFNLAPRPVGDTMLAMIHARVVMAGVRLGVFERLLAKPAEAGELARDLSLDEAGARHLLESLRAAGHVTRDGSRYAVAKRARKWLDPGSDTYVGGFVDFNYDQWDWWSRLEEIVRSGEPVELHEIQDDDYWERYIRGQYELARLSGPEVAKALRLPDEPRSLLDAAGGHGWFAAELCRRHSTLRATVLDLPPSARVGRRIMDEAGMADRVTHVEGDLAEADLGGPHDAALAFNIIHHLSPEENVAFLRRLREALKPGGTLAILDLFVRPGDEPTDVGAYLGLHFYILSGAATYSPAELGEWLREAGFQKLRRVRIRSIPTQTLYEARVPG